jgi:hypothetical protein
MYEYILVKKRNVTPIFYKYILFNKHEINSTIKK